MHFNRDIDDKPSIYVEKLESIPGSTSGAGSSEYYNYKNRRRDVRICPIWNLVCDSELGTGPQNLGGEAEEGTEEAVWLWEIQENRELGSVEEKRQTQAKKAE